MADGATLRWFVGNATSPTRESVKGYRASSAFHSRVRAENNKAASFLLPVSHAASVLCRAFSSIDLPGSTANSVTHRRKHSE
jgi:hypothetical protein